MMIFCKIKAAHDKKYIDTTAINPVEKLLIFPQLNATPSSNALVYFFLLKV